MSRVFDSRDAGAFITAALDDFGLDPFEFRLYARIVRRAGTREGCFESIDNMAKSCEMNRDTAYRALKTLIGCRLIEKEPRPGKSSSYYLTPQSEWVPKSHLSQKRDTSPIPNLGHHLSQKRDTTYPKSGTPPIPKTGHEGSPSKGSKEGINKNKNPLPPSELPAPEVRREDFSQNGSAGKIRTERKLTPLTRNFMEDGPWGDLARDLGLNPESVWKAFAEYLRDVHREKGLKDLDGYCSAIESKLFQTPGLEKSNSLWQKFERHFREHRSAPITERRQNAPGCEIKLPDLPTDEEAEQGRLELKKRLSGRKSVAEVTQ